MAVSSGGVTKGKAVEKFDRAFRRILLKEADLKFDAMINTQMHCPYQMQILLRLKHHLFYRTV